MNFLALGCENHNLNLPLMWISRLISCLIVYFRQRKMPLQAASSLHQDAYRTLPPKPVRSRQVGGGGGKQGWRPGLVGRPSWEDMVAWHLPLFCPALSFLSWPRAPGYRELQAPSQTRKRPAHPLRAPGLAPSQPKFPCSGSCFLSNGMQNAIIPSEEGMREAQCVTALPPAFHPLSSQRPSRQQWVPSAP